MIKRVLLLLVAVLTIGCPGPPEWPYLVITIINNSEHNITWVIIMNDDGYAYLSERNNELIAKNGGSYSYDMGSRRYYSNLIVCMKAEDTPEFMCVDEFELKDEETKAFIWNGSGDSVWQAK